MGLTTLTIIGVEELSSTRRIEADTLGVRAGLKLYGYREHDAARRMVAVELVMKDAAEYMRDAGEVGGFSEIEIDDKHWTYVSGIGQGQARFIKEDSPNGPTT